MKATKTNSAPAPPVNTINLFLLAIELAEAKLGKASQYKDRNIEILREAGTISIERLHPAKSVLKAKKQKSQWMAVGSPDITKRDIQLLTRTRKRSKVHSVTVKFNDDGIEIVQRRARAIGVSRAEYLRLRGLQPVGRLKKAREVEAIDLQTYQAYMAVSKELKCQGNNLNQIARGINQANLEGRTFNGYLQALSRIHQTIEGIANSIAKIGVKS
jgi:hypothetical protein